MLVINKIFIGWIVNLLLWKTTKCLAIIFSVLLIIEKNLLKYHQNEMKRSIHRRFEHSWKETIWFQVDASTPWLLHNISLLSSFGQKTCSAWKSRALWSHHVLCRVSHSILGSLICDFRSLKWRNGLHLSWKCIGECFFWLFRARVVVWISFHV